MLKKYYYSINVPILVFWWLLVCWTFSTAWPRPFDDPKNFIFYLGAGLISLGYFFKNRIFKISLTLPLFFLAFYLLAVFLSLGNPLYENLLSVSRLLLWIGLAYVLTQLPLPALTKLFPWTVISACFIVLISILHFHEILFVPIPGYFYWPIGFIAYFGEFLALHLPIGLCLLMQANSFSKKILWGFALLLISSGVWLSGNRASFLGICAASILLGVHYIKISSLHRKNVLLLFVILTAALFVVQKIHPKNLQYTSTLENFSRFFQKDFDWDRRTNNRWTPMLYTLDMIREKPYRGWGLGSFRFVFPKFAQQRKTQWVISDQFWTMHPHNEILNQFAEVGIFGGIAFLGFWGSLFFFGIGSLSEQDRDKKLLLLTSLAGVIISFVHWQFSTNFLFPLSRLFAAFYLALLWQLGRTRHQKTISLAAPFFRYGILLCLISLIIFVSTYQMSLFFVQKNIQAKNMEESLNSARAAHSLAPYAFDPLFQYAKTNLKAYNLDIAHQAITELSHHFPYVPQVLLLKTIRERENNGSENESKNF